MVIVDLSETWELAVVLLLIAVLISLLLLPNRIANRLAGGDIASNLRQIGTSAAQASRHVKTLNDELAAGAELGRWRSIMQTSLGAVVGLAGGFLAPWVSEASLGCAAVRGALVLAGATAAVLLMSAVVFPHIDARIRAGLEQEAG